MKTVDLSGIWECSVPGQSGEIRLPGTLDDVCLFRKALSDGDIIRLKAYYME